MNQIPLGRDVHSLVMRNDGALYYNNEEKNRLPANNLPQEGDVVVSFLRLPYFLTCSQMPLIYTSVVNLAVLSQIVHLASPSLESAGM